MLVEDLTLETVLYQCREFSKVSFQPPTALELAGLCGATEGQVQKILDNNKEHFRVDMATGTIQPSVY